MHLGDLSTVAPEVQLTLKRLQNIVRERDEILANPTLDQDTKNYKVKHPSHATKFQNFENKFLFMIYRLSACTTTVVQ